MREEGKFRRNEWGITERDTKSLKGEKILLHDVPENPSSEGTFPRGGGGGADLTIRAGFLKGRARKSNDRVFKGAGEWYKSGGAWRMQKRGESTC